MWKSHAVSYLFSNLFTFSLPTCFYIPLHFQLFGDHIQWCSGVVLPLHSESLWAVYGESYGMLYARQSHTNCTISLTSCPFIFNISFIHRSLPLDFTLDFRLIPTLKSWHRLWEKIFFSGFHPARFLTLVKKMFPLFHYFCELFRRHTLPGVQSFWQVWYTRH